MPKHRSRSVCQRPASEYEPSAATSSAARRRRRTGCTLRRNRELTSFVRARAAPPRPERNDLMRPSRPRTAPTRRGKHHTHATRNKPTTKHTGCDPRARRADGAHLLRRLLGNGRHPEPLHDRDGAREPRALGTRVHLLVHRDGVEDHLEFSKKVVFDRIDGLPRLRQHQHPGRGAEEARRDHERRAQERPALHGPHGRARLRGGGRARRGRRRHRGEVPEGGARREDAR